LLDVLQVDLVERAIALLGIRPAIAEPVSRFRIGVDDPLAGVFSAGMTGECNERHGSRRDDPASYPTP
jgi:hypothetical protein